MSLELYIALGTLIGAFAGLAAGLLGLGGGVVMAPLLLFLLEAGGSTPEQAALGAVATSTAAILFTSVPSALVHAWHKSVNWRQLRWIFPTAAVGALLSTQLAQVIPAVVLVISMVVLLSQSGWKVLRAKTLDHKTSGVTKLHSVQLLGLGLGAGLVGPLTGTGGGVVVSAMLVQLRQPMIMAIGTSAGATFFVAAAGTLGYSGSGAVSLMLLIYLAPACAIMAAVGARLANVLPRRWLQKTYALFMFLVVMRLGYWLFVYLGAG